MSFDPVALVERFHAAINALDFETIEAFFTEEARYTSGKVGGLEGRAAIMTGFQQYFAEYPDQVAEDSLIEAVSTVSARAVWSLFATSRTTGEPLQRQGEETITFNEQGRIVEVDVTDY